MERLAIEGGQPVRDSLLPYGHQFIDNEDIEAVVAVLGSDWITQGPKIEEFENRIAEYCGARYAVAVSSGTAALHAACSIAGISNGDEVITTPITFAATANAIVYCGGRPIFADIEEETFNIDCGEIERRISFHTKAIIPVDFTGHPAEYDAIRAIARENNLIVIEDACHALGAEYKGHRTGGLADMTILSFHPIKHITTGEGGMILTDNGEYYKGLKAFRHHGIFKDNSEKGDWYYEIQKPGYNLRITDFQCALGISQLKKLDSFIARRREIAARYNDSFYELEEVSIPVEKDGAKAVYHIYILQLKTELLKTGRNEVYAALRAENIGVNVHYIPLHLQPFYQREFGYGKGDYPKAERYYECAITLPLFPKMSDDDVNDVINAVKKVIHYFRR